jgi:hypothetical protein
MWSSVVVMVEASAWTAFSHRHTAMAVQLTRYLCEMLLPFFTFRCLAICETAGMFLALRHSKADASRMANLSVPIYHCICDECDRPALTFDRSNGAFCPTQAIAILRAVPLRNVVEDVDRLSGWSVHQGNPRGRPTNGH